MKVEFSRRAKRELLRIARWWQEHVTSPEVFLDELERVVEQIETTAALGVVYQANAPCVVYRRLMKKSACHLYLARQSEDLVVVVSIWGARRRRGPKFRAGPGAK